MTEHNDIHATAVAIKHYGHGIINARELENAVPSGDSSGFAAAVHIELAAFKKSALHHNRLPEDLDAVSGPRQRALADKLAAISAEHARPEAAV